MPVATDTTEDENDGGLLTGARMRAGTPALPVWVPAPRSGSGTGFAGVTILVCQAAPGVIFRGMTPSGALGMAEGALRQADGWRVHGRMGRSCIMRSPWGRSPGGLTAGGRGQVSSCRPQGVLKGRTTVPDQLWRSRPGIPRLRHPRPSHRTGRAPGRAQAGLPGEGRLHHGRGEEACAVRL